MTKNLAASFDYFPEQFRSIYRCFVILVVVLILSKTVAITQKK